MKSRFYIVFTLCLAAALSRAQATYTATVQVYSTSCEQGKAAVHIDGTGEPFTYQWSTGALSDSVSNLPAGNYWVSVTDSGGVDTTLNFTVAESECEVKFDNRFTPNDDGINDTWGASASIREFPEFLLQVYDRWGQQVHQQRGSYIPWDGRHLGIKSAEATYYWIFFYKEGDSGKFEKGNVTIVR